MLFVLGGNGTHAGANAIHEEVLMSIILFHFSSILFLSHAYIWPIKDLSTCKWTIHDFFLGILLRLAHLQTKNRCRCMCVQKETCFTLNSSCVLDLSYWRLHQFMSPQLQCRKRKLKVSVVAVPKTIDNDILLMDKTFGFDTAVEEAQRAINSAYIEVGWWYLLLRCSVIDFV